MKRYRNERNVYRVKYEKLKECSPSEKSKEVESYGVCFKTTLHPQKMNL